ncbi:TPA: hypothetical protein DEB00_01250 [Candidatus Uhrbacteria bacterium]|nr:hypothetical protein [Candidatus Uhrbacteria bacterium]
MNLRLCFLGIFLLFAMVPTASFAESAPTPEENIASLPLDAGITLEPIFPTYQVWIPGLDNKDIVTIGDDENDCERGYICINTINTYLNAIYKWMAGSGILFSIVLIMMGGVEWMVGSSVGTINKGKGRIQNAIVGLLLILTSTTFLTFINPEITSLKPVKMRVPDYIQEINISGDTPEVAETNTAVFPEPIPTEVPAPAQTQATAATLGIGARLKDLTSLGVICPKAANVNTVQEIAHSFVGHVSYRLGGKGNQQAPFIWELPPKSSNPKMDNQGNRYGDYCPNNTIALDCSGYADAISRCAGLPPRNVGQSTNSIFANTPEIINCTDENVVTLADGSEHTLEPGDYLGWGSQHVKSSNSYYDDTTAMGTPLPSKRPMSWGHIYIYIGNGLVTNSVGSGRDGGTAIVERTLNWACARYPLRLRAVGT